MNNNQTVIVTGASSGIGAAIASALATDGYTVACLSRRGTTPDASSAEVGTRLVGVTCDVSIEDDRASAVNRAVGLGPPLAGLVNGAGFEVQTPSHEVSLDELHAVLDTNLVGAIRMCQLTFDSLKSNGPGSLIVNIGSFFAKLGVPNFLAYSASKAGMAAMTRTLGVEWAPYGISVIDIAPGYVETGLNVEFLKSPGNREKLARKVPAGRLGTAEEIARLVAMLYRERIGFLTGETIYVDGAQGVRL